MEFLYTRATLWGVSMGGSDASMGGLYGGFGCFYGGSELLYGGFGCFLYNLYLKSTRCSFHNQWSGSTVAINVNMSATKKAVMKSI
jgi:hypothetical protein